MAADASPSWSGFNYQGKVAIYYALKMINATPAVQGFSNYSLMLENIEDFEIQHDGNPVSLHQVKAYNVNSYSSYSNALLGLALELYKKPNAIGKIHTWKVINSKSDSLDLIDSIKDDLRELLDESNNSLADAGMTIIEKAASSSTGVPKKAAILRAAFPGQTVEQYRSILSSIKDDADSPLTKLAAYTYDDGNNCCGLEEINEKVKSEISIALISRGVTVTPEQLSKTFYSFLGVMDAYIIQRHKTKQESENLSISFDEITESLIDHENISDEYLASKFKSKFADLIQAYMEDPGDYQEPEDDATCNLKVISKYLLGLTPQELWFYYRNFCPDTYLEHDNNVENAFEVNSQGIQYVLIKILHGINAERATFNVTKSQLSYRRNSSPPQHYLPTTIYKMGSFDRIEKSIRSNRNAAEILYEIENLIYEGSDTEHSFNPGSICNTEAPAAEDDDPRSKRDEVLKQITLVPISIAQEALT